MWLNYSVMQVDGTKQQGQDVGRLAPVAEQMHCFRLVSQINS